jgi:putative zinc finger/helix-turn-helix YgiT family protein
MVTRRENFLYKGSGLPGVTLQNVEVSRCSSCGEYEVSIPRIESLHRAIALELIEKPTRLTPEEIRFLRKYLGLSGTDFAKMMHVDPSTVSRWEKGIQPMGEVSDTLLRTQVLLRKPVDRYPVNKLSEVAKEEPAPLRIALKPAADGWKHTTL